MTDDLRPDPGADSSASVVADVAVRLVLAAGLAPSADLDALPRDALGPHLRA